jgi:predicted ArsR family transcriptional regulator
VKVDEPVSRRDAAKLLGWGYNTAKRALVELLAHELVQVVDKNMPRLYQVADDSLAATTYGLTNPSDL